MNQLKRNPSSSSRRGTGTLAAVAASSARVARSPAAPADGSAPGAHGSNSTDGNHAALAAASPSLLSFQAAGFPVWWISSSPMFSRFPSLAGLS